MVTKEIGEEIDDEDPPEPITVYNAHCIQRLISSASAAADKLALTDTALAQCLWDGAHALDESIGSIESVVEMTEQLWRMHDRIKVLVDRLDDTNEKLGSIEEELASRTTRIAELEESLKPVTKRPLSESCRTFATNTRGGV